MRQSSLSRKDWCIYCIYRNGVLILVYRVKVAKFHGSWVSLTAACQKSTFYHKLPATNLSLQWQKTNIN